MGHVYTLSHAVPHRAQMVLAELAIAAVLGELRVRVQGHAALTLT